MKGLIGLRYSGIVPDPSGAIVSYVGRVFREAPVLSEYAEDQTWVIITPDRRYLTPLLPMRRSKELSELEVRVKGAGVKDPTRLIHLGAGRYLAVVNGTLECVWHL